MGTHWELEGNIVGTHWEHRKNEKKNPPPQPNFKKKESKCLECMLGPSYWLHEISLPIRAPHHFWPGPIPLAKNTLPIGVLLGQI